MAIILPQGRFNNSSDKYIRDFISEQCRILAVIGLHVNVFKPHTGTKTSVLLVQKWDDVLCPRKEDYPIFTAAMQKPGKDNSGDKIYVKGPDGRNLTDKNGHLIVEHDLFNHDGLTQDGIAEAFIEFAKREGLSFFGDARPCEVNLPDGLEYSEVMLSEIVSNNRWDAEYFSRERVMLYEAVKNRPHIVLGDIADVTDGIHESFEYDEDGGINMISATSPRRNYFDLSREAFISPKLHEANPRTALKAGDVILSSVGTIGNCAVVTEDILPANSSRSVGIIRLRSTLLPNMLSLFLISKYGRNQTRRETTGNVQPCLFIYKINELIIPAFSIDFQTRINTLAEKAHSLRLASSHQYSDAQAQLTQALHFDNFKISQANTAIISFSKMFDAGRYDAEYFMPKYDDIEAMLRTYDHDIKTLSKIAKYIFTGEYAEEYFTVDDKPKLRNYVRGTDIQAGHVQKDDTHCVDPEGFNKFVSSGDIVTGRVGTIGNFGVIDDELDGALCSDNIICFRLPPEYLPDVYALYFNLPIIQDFTRRLARGSVRQRLNQETLREVLIPLINEQTQAQIAENVQKSFVLRRKSEKLIDIAEKSVELAIEHDENFAMNYISSEEEKIS